jgi:ornithine carbamoyltransferase
MGDDGSLTAMKGKKIAVTWAHSPAYGKPRSVPQALITLLTRFGAHVTLAHPVGYDLDSGCLETAAKFAAASGGS